RMFDQSPPSTGIAAQTARPWTATLSRGDVVLFAFPHADEDGGKPKPRPCLVLDIAEILGKRFVSLACGTTDATVANTGYTIGVTRRADYTGAGLDEPISFAAQTRVLVPLTHKGFPTSEPSPVIGRLSGGAFDRMNAVRARLAAEADMRSARRDERRRRTAATRSPVTVARRPKLSLPASKSNAS
ncbi:MAG: hypothetical protein P8X77_18110, partial [Maritimibacter sp.]